jgi:hypothetical protein
MFYIDAMFIDSMNTDTMFYIDALFNINTM